MYYHPELIRRPLESVNHDTVVNMVGKLTTDSGTTTQWNLWFPETLNSYSIQGFNVKNFHKRMRRGQLLPQTPYDLVRITGSTYGTYDFSNASSPHQHYYTTNGKFVNQTAWMVDEDDVASYVPLDAQEYLVQEAAARIYSSGHDTLTFLAELTDVKHMFTNVAKMLLKGKLPRLNTLKGVSSEWLSYRYGWRTLIYDIKSLNDAIIGLNAGRQRYSEAARTHTRFTDSGGTSGSFYGLGTKIQSWTDVCEIRLVGSVTADIDVPQFQFNPLQTGWELIPFSFVLDWFVGVGKTLSAWSFLSLNKAYSASYGYHISLTRRYDMYVTNWVGAYSGTNTQKGTCTVEVKKRVPCRIPLLPQYRLRLDTMKILDLLGLVVQRTRRR